MDMERQLELGEVGENRYAPLAERMRPRTLDEVVGQPQLTEAQAPLRLSLEAGDMSSAILWGPPGTGKTTIALCLAREIDAEFEQLNAVTDGIDKLRTVIARASKRRESGHHTLLFIDEIARWNRAQQDALLPFVEDGTVILIGATTQNPAYELNDALLSRVPIRVLAPLGEAELNVIADTALRDVKRGVGIPIDDPREPYSLSAQAREHLLLLADGDARRLLNIIETVARMRTDGGVIELADIEGASGQRALNYDKGNDEHYATISAFIKSVRHSQVDAALYWLARMEAGGETPLFVARRLVISASEEVGTAEPQALAVAVAGMEAVKLIGPPECWINLAAVTAYLARAPKSWASYQGLQAARAAVAQHKHFPVPAQMRNPTTALARQLGHGQGYAHASQSGGEAVVCLPVELAHWQAYRASGRGADIERPQE